MGVTDRLPSTPGLPDLSDSVRRHVRYSLGRNWRELSPQSLFHAVAFSVRERLLDAMLETETRFEQADAKRLYYLSLEFLMGRSLRNNLYNLGIHDLCRDALRSMGVDLQDVEECEPDAALGNGGLGRLAACFLDSLATLDMPGYGVGINYEYGLFKQEIINGYQKEQPDSWLANGTPWEIERPDEACIIPVYGRIEHAVDRAGQYNPMWMDWKVVIGIPHDMPIVGYGGRRSISCDSIRLVPRMSSTCRYSTTAITSKPSSKRWPPRLSRKSCTRQIRSGPGRSYACSTNTFSSLARSETLSGDT